jgi:hypothetical protein
MQVIIRKWKNYEGISDYYYLFFTKISLPREGVGVGTGCSLLSREYVGSVGYLNSHKQQKTMR